jgi:hypothetical protein
MKVHREWSTTAATTRRRWSALGAWTLGRGGHQVRRRVSRDLLGTRGGRSGVGLGRNVASGDEALLQ